MLDTFWLFFDELRCGFRFVDAFDISLVAALLYTGLVWFQRTASRRVSIGVAVLAAVYFVARGLDMYLTSLAFHATFAILLFSLVVVFQEDLRRMFERLATLRATRMGPAPIVGIAVDELVEAVFAMAANRTGALIVMQGKEPLARHLDSGIGLDGKLSKPLLYSIFDSHTPGHDGAVIVKNRIVQFAAHLPISKNTKEIAGRGTRHCAALGLSERSDALIIVISEEQGTVAVAEAGRLRVMDTAADLKRQIDRFLAATAPGGAKSFTRRLLLQHGLLKGVAVLLAVVAWFALAYAPDTIQRTFIVPIEYRNLPENLILDEDSPAEARVTISGSERSFRFLEHTKLKITVGLADFSAGDHEFSLSEENI